jgi:hypothetical protein
VQGGEELLGHERLHVWSRRVIDDVVVGNDPATRAAQVRIAGGWGLR